MLKLKIVVSTEFNDETQEFIENTVDVELEHSLASMSKWEEIWEVPLLSTNDKTVDQTLSYFVCMSLTPDVTPELFTQLSSEQHSEISQYLDGQHTATWFSSDNPQARSGEVITAELIYYWMSSFRIDWEAQYWNLNRLLTLVKIFSVKQDNKPQRTRRSRSDMDRMMAMNNQRRAELGSNG